jgi:membrane-bound lytic murein transglycosylase D
MIMRRILILKNNRQNETRTNAPLRQVRFSRLPVPHQARSLSGSIWRLVAPLASLTAGLTMALIAAGCATSNPSSTSSATSSSRPLASKVVATPKAASAEDFLSKESAAEAAEFIRLGRESMREAAWFEAAEFLDSAMTHLALLEAHGELSRDDQRFALAWRDSVREWMVEAVVQSDRLGGAEDLSDYIDHEIEEVSLASLEDLEALIPRLPDRNFELPLPSPLPHSVLQAMRVFTGSGRGYFEKWLQRRGRYEALIHGRLEERGMPRDLLYLSMIESGFNPKAWSHASASGLWQFISGTGRRYGLKDDWWEDARRDPVRATDAALDYLEDLYAEFGDWHLAMAAYNCGEGRVRRQLRIDSSHTFWTLSDELSLPKETRYYVPKILAAMIIGRNPAVFGFNTVATQHPPLRFDTVTVTEPMAIRGIAGAVGVSEDSLKGLNPALRRWSTPPGRATYTVYLPEGTRDLFLANRALIDVLPPVSMQSHRVTRGQTLSGIASRYGVSMADIRAANGLKGTRVRIGQVLTIPVTGYESSSPRVAQNEQAAPVALGGRHTVRSGETLSGIARRYRVAVSALRQANGMRPSTILQAGRVLDVPGNAVGREYAVVETTVEPSRVRRIHTVRSGETLSGIAARFGVTQTNLRSWNNLKGSNLRIGQKLVYHSSRDGALIASNAEAEEYYRVRSGDNLWAISSRFGHSVDDLKRLNGGLTEALQPGQRIRVR